MKRPKWDIYQDTAGQYRWRLVSSNGRIIAQGESHTRRADAFRACHTVQDTAALARVEK